MQTPLGDCREIREKAMALTLSMRNIIAGAVVSVWTITALASIVTNNYTSLGAVTPVMMIVSGFLFGSRSSSSRSNGSGNSHKEGK
jgi:ATP/ADP translocase